MHWLIIKVCLDSNNVHRFVFTITLLIYESLCEVMPQRMAHRAVLNSIYNPAVFHFKVHYLNSMVLVDFYYIPDSHEAQ